jgi:hypothetical protein
VRKNVAIVLARLVKAGGAAEAKIRSLRGVEMMVQLGDQLL